MRKIFFVVCLLLVSVGMSAGNPLKFADGKGEWKSIVSAHPTLEVVFDWDSATYDRQRSLLEEFDEDLDFIIDDCQTKFIAAFNEKSAGVTLQSSPVDGAEYRCVLTVEVLDSYFAAMRFVPQFEAKMWGSFTVVSVATGQPVVSITITEAEDGADFVRKECFGETFRKLGGRLGKLK